MPPQEYDRGNGENRRTNEQTRTKLGVNQEQRKVCNTICMCRLSLAWVTSENSTSNSNADILRLNLLRWTLSCLLYCLQSLVLTAPVRGSTPTLCCSPLCCPTPTAHVRVPRQLPLCPVTLPSSRQLSFASPSHFRIRRDFMSKNPLSGFASKQTKESSALAAHPHSATHCIVSFLFNGQRYKTPVLLPEDRNKK